MIPGLGVSGYFVATDKIDLGNPQLQQTITKAIRPIFKISHTKSKYFLNPFSAGILLFTSGFCSIFSGIFINYLKFYYLL